MAVDGDARGRHEHSGQSTAQVCLYLLTFLWVFLSATLLLALGITYAARIRVLLYTRSTCRVAFGIYSTQYACSCGDKCRSLYPCYVVYVRGNWSDHSFDTIPLYDTDIQQSRAAEGSKDMKERCSSYKCDRNQQKNRDHVAKFELKYGIKGLTLECFYDPRNLFAGAILKRTESWTLAFHVLFWPSLCLLIGLVTCGFLCRIRIRKRKAKQQQMFLQSTGESGPVNYSSKCDHQRSDYASRGKDETEEAINKSYY